MSKKHLHRTGKRFKMKKAPGLQTWCIFSIKAVEILVCKPLFLLTCTIPVHINDYCIEPLPKVYCRIFSYDCQDRNSFMCAKIAYRKSFFIAQTGSWDRNNPGSWHWPPQKKSVRVVASDYKQISGGYLMWLHVISSGQIRSWQACNEARTHVPCGRVLLF